MKERIHPIDGLRAIAVIGVMWKHLLGFYENVPLMVGKININKAISIAGNGVDLFFVISGFCMYLMYVAKAGSFKLNEYGNFLKKRFMRIAPAFYVLIAVEVIRHMVQYGNFPTETFLYHVFFISIFLPVHNDFAPHYWSLATEWHFYLVLPFLFIGIKNRKHIIRRILAMIVICIIFRLFLYYDHRSDLLEKNTIPADAIWYRFAEFGFGIIAAKLYLDKYQLPVWFRGFLGFILSFLIAYAGRIFMLTEFVNLFGNYGFIIRALGDPLMTLGFSIMMYNLISTKSIFSGFFSCKPMLFIGRISYSMYLWHFIICLWVSRLLMPVFGVSNLGLYSVLISSVIVATPVSWLSYKLLEMPYFKRTNHFTPLVLGRETA